MRSWPGRSGAAAASLADANAPLPRGRVPWNAERSEVARPEAGLAEPVPHREGHGQHEEDHANDPQDEFHRPHEGDGDDREEQQEAWREQGQDGSLAPPLEPQLGPGGRAKRRRRRAGERSARCQKGVQPPPVPRRARDTPTTATA